MSRSQLSSDDAIRLARWLHFQHASDVELVIGDAKAAISRTCSSTIDRPAKDTADAHVIRPRTCPTAIIRPTRAYACVGRQTNPDLAGHRSIAATEHTGFESRLPLAAVLSRRIDGRAHGSRFAACRGRHSCGRRFLPPGVCARRDQQQDHREAKENEHRSVTHLWSSPATRARRSPPRRQRRDLYAKVVRGSCRTLSTDAPDRERFSHVPAPQARERSPSGSRKLSS